MAPLHHSRFLIIIGLVIVFTITFYQFSPRSYRSSLPQWNFTLPGKGSAKNHTSIDVAPSGKSVGHGKDPHITKPKVSVPVPESKPEVPVSGTAGQESGLDRLKSVTEGETNTASLIENDPMMKSKFGKGDPSEKTVPQKPESAESADTKNQTDKSSNTSPEVEQSRPGAGASTNGKAQTSKDPVGTSKGDQQGSGTGASTSSKTQTDKDPTDTSNGMQQFKSGQTIQNATTSEDDTVTIISETSKNPGVVDGTQSSQNTKTSSGQLEAGQKQGNTFPITVEEPGIQEVESLEQEVEEAYKAAHEGKISKEGQTSKSSNLKSEDFDYKKAHDGMAEKEFAKAMGHSEKISGSDDYPAASYKSTTGTKGNGKSTSTGADAVDESEHVDLRERKVKAGAAN